MTKTMPIKTAKGTTIGPVALICATICFLAMIAALVVLIIVAPQSSEIYLRPLIPTLAALGSAALLWFKTHQTQELNTQQNVVIAEKADEAAVKAEQATEVVSKRLNGELDARLENAITRALDLQKEKEQG